jgi:zinc and cadmium transporter
VCRYRLISVSVMHVIPKSFEMDDAAPVFLLVGFLGIHLSNRLLDLYVCHRYESADYAVGIIPMVEIGFHSFIDGVIYSVTFNVSILTGVLSAIGMVLHEFPEGIVTFVLLERGGFSRKQLASYAFWAAALSTPLGTLVSYPLINTIERSTLGILLAVSAGALVYVGASHLLPAVDQVINVVLISLLLTCDICRLDFRMMISSFCDGLSSPDLNGFSRTIVQTRKTINAVNALYPFRLVFLHPDSFGQTHFFAQSASRTSRICIERPGHIGETHFEHVCCDHRI